MTVALTSNSDGTSGTLSVADVAVMNFGSDTSGQLSGFRNYLYNGGARVSVKGNTAVIVNTWQYGGADRTCIVVNSTTASGTIQQYNGVATTTGYAQGVNVTATTTGTGWVWFQQRIEAINAIPLNSKTITLSCILYQKTGSVVSSNLYISKPTTGLNDYSGGLTNIATGPDKSIPSGVPTKVTYTIPLGSTHATNGLAVGAYFVFAGNVTSKDFWIGDFQLEQGSIATPFEVRPHTVEQLLCRRYLQIVSYNWTMWTLGGLGFGTNQFLPVPMRTTPAIVSNSVTTNSNITNSGLGLNAVWVNQPGYATATGQVVYKGSAVLSAEL